MAKISVEFDTTEKTLSCSIDGQAVADVMECSFGRYMDEDDFRCSITTRAEDEANDMRTYTHMCASQSRAAKESDPSLVIPSTHPDFVFLALSKPTLAEQVQKFLGGE